MDWITHYMAAFILGRRLRLGKGQTAAITLGALVLDVDVILYLLPGELSHGTLTHTLGGALALGCTCTVALFLWQRRWSPQWVALGIFSHLAIDMVNTLSMFDPGKRLLWPLTDTAFTLKDSVPMADLAWAIITAAIFSFSIVMLAVYIHKKDYPWGVWYDERSLVEYWRKIFHRS